MWNECMNGRISHWLAYDTDANLDAQRKSQRSTSIDLNDSKSAAMRLL